jgi:16S rRNA G966 N2-methylase RsmD
MSASTPGRHHPGNTLNDLTGKDWLTFTRTWFQQVADEPELPDELAAVLRRYAADLAAQCGEPELNDLDPSEWVDHAQSWFLADSKRYWQNKDTELHPARYPEEMVERFLAFFTKRGMWVLDPFAGSGATLVSCAEHGRNGVGIEISPRYAETARRRLAERFVDIPDRQVVISDDSRQAARPGFWDAAVAAGCPTVEGRPQFDFVITSPPYCTMLRTSRGGVLSAHKERAAKGLDTHYSDNDADLGNLSDYDAFVEALGGVFDGLHPFVRPGRYVVIVLQNFRAPDGRVRPLAWDVARRVALSYAFQGERIWCQNTKKLGIWGYPKVFVPNYHHHYCLIFRRA